VIPQICFNIALTEYQPHLPMGVGSNHGTSHCHVHETSKYGMNVYDCCGTAAGEDCNRIFFLQALRSTWTASLLEDGFETMQTPVVSCSCWLLQNTVQVILAAHGNLEYLKVSGVGLLCSASGDLLGYKAEKKKQATGCSQADPIEANAA